MLTNNANKRMVGVGRIKRKEAEMNILTKSIVSNSDMIKNYKACRDKAADLGKIFILKNNKPDAVLFSRDEYERMSEIIEYLEMHDEEELKSILKTLPRAKSTKRNLITELRDELKKITGVHFTDGFVQGVSIASSKLEEIGDTRRIELKELV